MQNCVAVEVCSAVYPSPLPPDEVQNLASSVCDSSGLQARCTPQAEVHAASRSFAILAVLSPVVPCVWLQTLQDTRVSIGLAGPENLGEPILRDAKEEGIMCPELVELVCEALESSGRDA